MCCSTSGLYLEPGLDIQEIEDRLAAVSVRYDREERYIAYYLLEVERRNLFKHRGFSSIYDFADALIDMNRRKTQSLLCIARRLEELPAIAAAFDAGRISWTKVREITKVATREDEEEWLAKARRLSCRELEKTVRQDGRCSSNRFPAIRISMPEEVLNLWVQCEEIAERQAEKTLEPWQVLEQMMAEYLSTYAAAETERISHRRETEDEQDIPLETRLQVLERDGHRCRFPGCSMRAHLGIHHIRFRSQGGGHEPENLLLLCDAHHGLIHDRICSVEGEAPDELVFKGPFLSEFPRIMEAARRRASGASVGGEEGKTEEEPASPKESEEQSAGAENEDEGEPSEDWSDETETPDSPHGDPLSAWLDDYARQKRKDRWRQGRRGGHVRGHGRDHVIADREFNWDIGSGSVFHTPTHNPPV